MKVFKLNQTADFKSLHTDIARFLKEDCYCPNEIYSVDGFGYVLVQEDAESVLLGEYKNKAGNETIILAATTSDFGPILVNIWIDDATDKILNIERYDLTEDNIRNMRKYWESKESYKFELSEKGKLIREISEIIKCSDAIMIN